MGSRFKGSIEPGAMPRAAPLFRHAGHHPHPQPACIGSSFSDIHCGMRGMTREALARMDLASQSWEYASEMVLKSVHMQLRTAEVPVRFLKDPEGRLSHHEARAAGFAVARRLDQPEAMFIYGADFFLVKPGPCCSRSASCSWCRSRSAR